MHFRYNLLQTSGSDVVRYLRCKTAFHVIISILLDRAWLAKAWKPQNSQGQDWNLPILKPRLRTRLHLRRWYSIKWQARPPPSEDITIQTQRESTTFYHPAFEILANTCAITQTKKTFHRIFLEISINSANTGISGKGNQARVSCWGWQTETTGSRT